MSYIFIININGILKFIMYMKKQHRRYFSHAFYGTKNECNLLSNAIAFKLLTVELLT